MRSALLIAIFVTCAFWSGVQAMAADRTAPRTWNPSIAQVRKIDSLVLALPVPQGTNPASAYTRYYARVRINGRQMIYGSIVSARLESYLEANHHVPSVIAALSRFVRVAADPGPITRDVSVFPEFRKHGSHPYESRWDAFYKDPEMVVDGS